MLNAGQYFADYRIVRSLGVGGMGEVYLAAHPRLPREDALKVLPAELTSDATYRARFTREADLASQLDHPSIVSVYDRGEFQGQLWITMKFIPGSDCDAMLKRDGVPEPRAVAEIVAAVADALDYAHSRDMVHRDVKPANVLVDDTSSRRKIYLTDFGIARTLGNDTALTAANLTVGSIQYCSPEQLRGQDLDGRSDQYALACTAYRLLTGRAPFPLTTPTAIINAHLNTVPPSATRILPTLAPAVDQVLARAMSKEPAGRYRTCGEFATEFTSALTRPGFTPASASAYAPTMIKPSPIQARPPQPPTAPQSQQTPHSGPSHPLGSGTAPYTAQGPTQQPQQTPRPTPPPPPPQPQPNQPPAVQQQYAQPPFGQPKSPQQYGQRPAAAYGAAGGFGPPPGGYGGHPVGADGSVPSSKSNTGKIIAIVAAVVLVLALIAVIGFVVFSGDDEPGTAAGSSSSTTTGFTSPSTSSRPSTSSSPSTSVGRDAAVVNGVPTQCSVGAAARTTTIRPLTNLNITIPEAELPPGAWRPETGLEIPFAVTAAGINAPRPSPSSQWQAAIIIGTLPSAFGDDTAAIARKLIDCLPTSNGYASSDPSSPSITETKTGTLDDKTTKVALVRATLRVSGQSGIDGDDLIVAVINSSPMTFAVGMSPIGDSTTKREVEKAVLGVKVR